MPQIVDSPTDRGTTALSFFRITASGVSNASSSANLNKAVDAFERFLGPDADIPLGSIRQDLLARWVLWMHGQGYTRSSTEAYLSKLSSLYGKAVKAGVAERTDAFGAVRNRIAELSDRRLAISADSGLWGKLRRLVTLTQTAPAELRLACDVTLMGIFLGGVPLGELASLRKDDCADFNEQATAIAQRYSRPRNKYLFPLGQSTRTTAQLGRAVSALAGQALQAAGITSGNAPADILADLWAAIALRCGFDPATIAGCLPAVPSGSIYSFADPEQVAPQRKSWIIGRVAESLGTDPDGWYAMQFRPRVAYETVTARMEACSLKFSQSFYPMEEIMKRVGGRTVAKRRPIVPGLLFFKYRASALTALYRSIGDLAWGYRTGRNSSSPYATISAADIDLYRTTIGQFDDTTEVFPAGTIELQPGDRVEIVGGPFIGHKGVYAEQPCKGGRTICRLRLMGDNAIEWCVDADVRLLRKI